MKKIILGITLMMVLFVAACSTPQAETTSSTVPVQKAAVPATPAVSENSSNLVSAPESASSAEVKSNPSTTTVSIKGFKFQQNTVEINAGDTIEWVNEDSAPHTVTFEDTNILDEKLSSKGKVSHTFTEKGTFEYHCSFHPNMKGIVVVK